MQVISICPQCGGAVRLLELKHDEQSDWTGSDWVWFCENYFMCNWQKEQEFEDGN